MLCENVAIKVLTWWVLIKQNQCKKNYSKNTFRFLIIAKTVIYKQINYTKFVHVSKGDIFYSKTIYKFKGIQRLQKY
jgi:hypothetical protein